jgi:SHS family lactate transporter-like MFS transporter
VASNAAVPRQRLTPDQRNSFIAAQLGWTMDAFDYFIVVLVYADIAKDFHVSLTKMAFLTTVTLLMRSARCCSGCGPTGSAGVGR